MSESVADRGGIASGAMRGDEEVFLYRHRAKRAKKAAAKSEKPVLAYCETGLGLDEVQRISTKTELLFEERNVL